jgi:hypothetical protein
LIDHRVVPVDYDSLLSWRRAGGASSSIDAGRFLTGSITSLASKSHRLRLRPADGRSA